ncbi:MAG TPA: hypothetical protein VGX28_12935 [Frankiaceae bacterium]|nr:hypothetical protein [Frankiaceae bacterium]
MLTPNLTFTYRLSRIDGVPRLDVRGAVDDGDFAELASAIDDLAAGGADSLILGLSQATVSRELCERLTEHAHRRLPHGRVLVDTPFPAYGPYGLV